MAKRKQKAPETSEDRILKSLKRIEELLEKSILFQARTAGANRANLAKWMRVDNNRIAAVSKVVKSKEKAQ